MFVSLWKKFNIRKMYIHLDQNSLRDFYGLHDKSIKHLLYSM